MKTVLTFFVFLLLCNSSFGQDNKQCQEDFNWLSNYIETSLPAFQNDITNKNRTEYLEFKSQIKNQVSKANSTQKCFKSLARYTEYFFDNHTQLVINNTIQIDEKSQESIEEFKNTNIYKSVERIAIDVNVILEKYKDFNENEIEGIYKSSGGAYQVVVMKSDKANRSYIGVILNSTTKLWEPGMVKFELLEIAPNRFEAFYYYRNHSVVYRANEIFKNGRFSEGWHKVSANTKIETDGKEINRTPTSLFHFKKLSDSTNYLYLQSFDGKLKPRFDSLYAAIEPKIKALPNLIIDIRNNGGGSDMNIKFLRNIMYTNPYHAGRQQIWNSEAVQKHYQDFLVEAKADSKTYGKSTIKWIKEMLKFLKKNKKDTFVFTSKKKYPMKFKHLEFPKKIVVIQGKNTGSTSENVVISAINSSKTTTIGQNSGGYLGYGNIFKNVSPSGNYTLWASTTQNDYKMQFEANGIPPQIKLSKTKDWVKEAIKLLENE